MLRIVEEYLNLVNCELHKTDERVDIRSNILQISLLFEGCSVGMQHTAIGRTGYGIPDPVTSASVVDSSSNQCFVLWRKIKNLEDKISYKVDYLVT